jgi:outer membrane immunogenic protein
MAIKAPAVAAGPACAQFGGVYVGGQTGSTYYDYCWQDSDAFRGQVNDDHQAPDATSATKFGWHGGVLGGYNWQTRCTVFGIETDWHWSSAEAKSLLTLNGHNPVNDLNWDIRSKLQWFGTVRVRSDVAVDNLLLDVTGGLAYAHFKRNFAFSDPENSDFETLSGKQTRLGWTAGVGTEWR